MKNVERVRELSDRLLRAMPDENRPDVAIMALLDAAVRIVRFHNPGMDSAAACAELAKVGEFLSATRIAMRLTRCSKCDRSHRRR